MSNHRSPRLADVQAAFAQWRRTRTTHRTPLALRQQAVGLLAEHRISEVTSALGVNHGQLNRWRREVSPATDTTTDSAFVELPMALRPAPEVALPPAGVSLTLTRQTSDGGTLSISGQLSEAQWRWAMSLLQESEA